MHQDSAGNGAEAGVRSAEGNDAAKRCLSLCYDAR